MEDKKYPCRTEQISGTTYHVKMFSISDAKHRMSTSFQSKEEADGYVERMGQRLPEYRFEITESPWTSEVCVECGREEY